MVVVVDELGVTVPYLNPSPSPPFLGLSASWSLGPLVPGPLHGDREYVSYLILSITRRYLLVPLM